MKITLKKLSTILIGSTLSITMLLAQPGGQRPPMQGPPIPNDKQITVMVEELSKTLDLNKKQSEQISDLYTAHFKEVKTLMKKSQKQNDKNKKKMDKMKDRFDNEVKAILTPEQRKAFEAYIKEHTPQHDRGQNQQGPQRK